jgi:LysR family transcriptional regulator (chromosome initiation inhibitor)
MHLEQLRALAAVVDHGTFDAAARALHITPSAMSQRIKALENDVGRVVVQRSVPCVPTEAGHVLVRMARQVALLESDARDALEPEAGRPVTLPIAVNADSLSTWFAPVFTAAAGWDDTVLRIHVDDEDYSMARLRQGDVVGAVTADSRAAGGCRVEPLGVLRYLPFAAAELRDKFTTPDGLDWGAMPFVRFDAKDDMQHTFLRRQGTTASAPETWVPSTPSMIDAIRAGLGWGLVPEAEKPEERGLVRLGGDHLDVPLYWQHWRLSSPRLAKLTEALRAAAADLS